MSSPVLWTVGHSSHSFDRFVSLIGRHEIAFVVDVRSYPRSKFAPHFDREELAPRLRQRGIGYLFLGEELGGRPSDARHYDANGHALYGPMSREPAFRAALERLTTGAERHRIALMCSESDPTDCHRRLLVGKVLTERGAELRHILPDARVRVERVVALAAGQQSALFGEDDASWRSTRSVSHRRRLSTSSAG